MTADFALPSMERGTLREGAFLAKSPVVVHIAGQRYSVRSDADETYVRTLAKFVDGKMADLRDPARPVPTQKAAVLAALNIADDLFRERRGRTELESSVRERSQALLAFLEKAEGKYCSG